MTPLSTDFAFLDSSPSLLVASAVLQVWSGFHMVNICAKFHCNL